MTGHFWYLINLVQFNPNAIPIIETSNRPEFRMIFKASNSKHCFLYSPKTWLSCYVINGPHFRGLLILHNFARAVVKSLLPICDPVASLPCFSNDVGKRISRTLKNTPLVPSLLRRLFREAVIFRQPGEHF